MAQARVTVEEGTGLLRFDVLLYGLPASGGGHEVTVNFEAPQIDNRNIFYTDSNGLEMQRRQLNFRETWDVQSD